MVNCRLPIQVGAVGLNLDNATQLNNSIYPLQIGNWQLAIGNAISRHRFYVLCVRRDVV